MALSPISLGALVDRWVQTHDISVVETWTALTVSNLAAHQAAELYNAVPTDWSVEIADGAMQVSDVASLNDQMGPYIVTITKQANVTERRILTLVGLEQALARADTSEVWQIAGASLSFNSGLVSFNPWGHGDIFSPAKSTKSPLDLVREGAEARLVPSDIRKWLLRSPITDEQWGDPAFQAFAKSAAAPLLRSVVSEVTGKKSVIFAGPPRLGMAIEEPKLLEELQRTGFAQLQIVVAWVYEDPNSAEQRHGLFAAEFARSISREETIGGAFRKAGKDILEGARLAYQLSQSDLTREAIKAQGDLRKAIADDVTKMAETTRTLANAIAVAIATGIGLVAARSTGAGDPAFLSLIAVVVALYLLAITVSGWMHLGLQTRLRDEWRRRFYRFIPAEDYAAMVTKPALEAARPYHLVGAAAVAIAIALGYLAYVGWYGGGTSQSEPKKPAEMQSAPPVGVPSAPKPPQ